MLTGKMSLTPRVTHNVTDLLCRKRRDGQSFLQTVGVQRHVHVVSSCGGRSGYGKPAEASIIHNVVGDAEVLSGESMLRKPFFAELRSGPYLKPTVLIFHVYLP